MEPTAKSKTRSSPDPGLVLAGAALTDWYGERARDLPWRRSVTPYRVLVSEIMLQQTRAETVAPRFEQFMERFPDVAALAAASEEEVLKVWEGLGYYTRARSLHRTARILMEQTGGVIPAALSELRRLPGVGEYTAAAVLSIAFRQPAAALDANAIRIAFRLLACRDDPTSAAGRSHARQCLETMMRDSAPDAFTQAVMELGQTVCRPRRAECTACPLIRWCAGQDDPAAYPARPGKTPRPETVLTVAAVFTEAEAALRKRPDTGLLAGLYEPLNWKGELTLSQVLSRIDLPGIEIVDAAELTPWRHEFTHRIWLLRGWRIYVAAPVPLQDTVWADRQALSDIYALPAAFRPAVSEWESTPWKNLWSRDPSFGNT